MCFGDTSGGRADTHETRRAQMPRNSDQRVVASILLWQCFLPSCLAGGDVVEGVSNAQSVRALTASVSCGVTSNRSPTMP